MPEVGSKYIWKNALNDLYQNGCNGYERGPMTIKARIIFWLVKRPKEGGVSIQGSSRVAVIVGLVNTDAILVNSEDAHAQVYEKPHDKQDHFETILFRGNHANVTRAISIDKRYCIPLS